VRGKCKRKRIGILHSVLSGNEGSRNGEHYL
jgi:hypothetical protein